MCILGTGLNKSNIKKKVGTSFLYKSAISLFVVFFFFFFFFFCFLFFFFFKGSSGAGNSAVYHCIWPNF